VTMASEAMHSWHKMLGQHLALAVVAANRAAGQGEPCRTHPDRARSRHDSRHRRHRETVKAAARNSRSEDNTSLVPDNLVENHIQAGSTWSSWPLDTYTVVASPSPLLLSTCRYHPRSANQRWLDLEKAMMTPRGKVAAEQHYSRPAIQTSVQPSHEQQVSTPQVELLGLQLAELQAALQ